MIMQSLVNLFLFFLFFITAAVGDSNLDIEGRILKQIFNHSRYDKGIRPPRANSSNEDGPVDVTVNMFVRAIPRVDCVKSEYDLQLTFREEWYDERLKFDGQGRVEYVQTDELSVIWLPDVFFSNEKNGHFHDILTPNAFVRIFPNGRVLHSIRVSLTLYCQMQLRSFPFDMQVCPLRIATYKYSTRDLELIWKDKEPIQANTATSIWGYKFDGHNHGYCTSKTSTGEYSCLMVNFNLRRRFFAHLFHIYLPLVLLVSASWISFWLNPTLVFPRFAISTITTACTLLQIHSNGHLFLSTSHLTALDAWVAVCCLCVFGAFAECVYVYYINSNHHKGTANAEEGGTAGTDSKGGHAPFKFLWAKSSGQTPKIDVISQVSFPLLFVVLNIIYWPIFV